MRNLKRSLSIMLITAMVATALPFSVCAEDIVEHNEIQETVENISEKSNDAEVEDITEKASDFVQAYIKDQTAQVEETVSFDGGDGTESNPYLISTAKQLDKVRDNLSAYYKLTADIVFTEADFAVGGDFYNGGKGWIPIGNDNNLFGGTFDGNEKTITGLYVNTDSNFVGLFGCSKGTITSLGMVDSEIIANGSNIIFVGGIAGYNIEGTISNSYNTGSVSINSSCASYMVSIGGIAGANHKGTISNCYNTGDVNGTISNCTDRDNTVYVGGIVGYNGGGTISNNYNTGNVSGESSSSSYVYVGGIAGYNIEGTISNCYNTWDVNGTISNCTDRGNEVYVGGIAGYNDEGTISNSYNTGNVSGESSGSSYVYVGGIAGFNSIGTISNSYNTGNVSGESSSSSYVYVGGIAGYNNGTISNSYNTGSVSGCSEGNAYVGGIAGYNGSNGTISNSYNTGSVSGYSEDKAACMGGIAGYNYSGTIINCYYIDTCSLGIGSGTGTTTKCTAEQMQLQGTYVDFDFDTIWTMDGNEEYLYPELKSVPMKYEKPVLSISMYSLPAKTTYDLFENELVLTGGMITVNFEDGTTKNIDITEDMVSDYDNTNPGDKIITVTYRGSSTSFNITVTATDDFETYIIRNNNKRYYLTLADAISSIDNNEEIILRKNSTGESATVNKVVVFTIDSNGYSYNSPVPGTGIALETSVNDNKTTYTFVEGEYAVSLQSRVKGTNNSISNVIGGGLDITYFEGTTLVAPSITGYTFLGWYENYSSEDIGELVATESRYLYKPTRDITLTAVYEVNESTPATLKINASRFKVSGSKAIQNNSFVGTYYVGDSVTVTFMDSNSDFMYWANESNKIVSNSTEYTFTIGANTSLQAFCGDKEEGNQAFVIFVSAQDQIMHAKAYTTEDTISFPVVPSKYGCTFVEWAFEDGTTATEATIKERMATNNVIKVMPKYEAAGSKYTVTVNYYGITKDPVQHTDKSPAEACVVTADATVEDGGTKYFHYWRDSNGIIISYNPTYSIYSSRDITITAVYGEIQVQRQANVSIRDIFVEQVGGKYQTSFVEYYDILEDCTLIKTGFLVTLKKDKATETDLVVDGDGINQFESTLADDYGTYITNIVVSRSSAVIYARAFVQYFDSQGEVQTVYSEIVGKSYDDLK